MRILSLFFILFAFTLNNALAEDEKMSFSTKRVSGSIYMLYGTEAFVGGNIALTIGEDGLVLIDNGVPAALSLLKEEIAKTTDKPIDYLINTHVHGDHTGNNHYFGGEKTKIISHENLRASLLKNGVKNESGSSVPAPKEALPVITFSDKMTLHINGDTAKIVHFADAHTDGDAVIVFEKANVIHTGDILFNGRFPYIDNSNGGSFTGVVAALKAIHEMADEETKIIPGHGELATKADIATTIKMLETTYQTVAELVKAGKTDDEIKAAKPLADYESYSWSFINSDRMLDQLLTAARQ